MEGWLTAAIIGLVVALVNVIGGGLVIRWLARQIRALKGTVDAQTETLKTIGEVNRTVLEVFKAMEPRRWAEEVQVHKKLADEKAAALVDEARRQFEKDKETLQETLKGYQEAVGVGLSLLPYVPKEERQKAVDDTAAPDSIKKVFLEVAATAPDWNRRLRTLDRLDALGTLAAGLAHEIKNPLTSLLAFSRHLERKFDDPNFRERFRSVVPRELERINGIVERLLELVRPARVSFTW